MSKLTRASRSASGVLEALRDLFAPYNGETAEAFTDDGTVAFLGVTANELAAPTDQTGAATGQTTQALGTTTYASKVFQTQGFGRIVGTIFSDTAGSLTISQSSDGTHWDQVDTVAVSASTGAKFSIEVVAPFAKVAFAGGGTQSNGTFRLFTWLRRSGTA